MYLSGERGKKRLKKRAWRVEQNSSIQDIVVIIAGNDIQWGKKYCQEVLDEIMKYSPKIYSAIPKYSQNDGDERDE